MDLVVRAANDLPQRVDPDDFPVDRAPVGVRRLVLLVLAVDGALVALGCEFSRFRVRFD